MNTTTRYLLTMHPMSTLQGSDFGPDIRMRVISSGMRVSGGERVVIDVEGPTDAFEAILDAADDVIEYAVAV